MTSRRPQSRGARVGLVAGFLMVAGYSAAVSRPDVGRVVLAEAAPKKKKVIRLDAITVEGRIQKPQAFYILQRSNLNFEELNRTDSFVPKIVKSVEKDPF